MEEEIQDKLDEIYNNQIILDVETNEKNKFKIHGSIKSFNLNVIRKGFIIYYNYDKNSTINYNINQIVREIDKNIIILFKNNCKQYDNWTDCEKRGCQGCFYNKYKNYNKEDK